MANNKTAKDAAGATVTYATDDVSGVDYPVVKAAFGADDTATWVSSSNGLPVDIVAGTVALSGEDHIGQLGGHVAVVKPTLTITTAIYAANDSLAGEITLTGAARTSGGSGVLTDIVIADEDGEGAALTILLFDSDPAATAVANGAFAWGSGDMARLIAVVQIGTGDYLTIDANKVAHKAGLGIAFKAVGSANLFAHILTVGTPTYTATTDMMAAFKFIQD